MIGPIDAGGRSKTPALFGAALGLAVILPLLNFLRDEPLSDFYGEWASVIALALAALAVLHRIPWWERLNWSVLAAPAIILTAIVVQLALGMYPYAEDWMIWTAYLWVASLALVLGQTFAGVGQQREVATRLAWALVLAAIVNFSMQTLQAARLDVDLQPYVIYRPDDWVCRLIGNVGQNNHSNTLAWLGIAGTIYLLSIHRVRAPLAAVLLAVLLLSSALTVSRMAWLGLAATMAMLAIRPLWPSLTGRSRSLLAVALLAGFAVASHGSGAIRENIDASCVSAIDRLVDPNEGGIEVRLMLWRQAVEVWKSSPLIGVGAGHFIGSVYALDVGEGRQPLDAYVHNLPLQLLAEFGLIVMAGLGAIVALWVASLIRHAAELKSEDGFILSGLAVLGIHSMLEQPLWYAHFLIITALFLGLLIRPSWSTLKVVVPARLGVLVMVVAVLAGSVVLVVDYRRVDRLNWVSQFIQGVGPARLPDAQATLEEAAAAVRFYGQFRDYSLVAARPLTKENLAQNIAIVDRALGRMPNINLVHMRVLLACLDGDLHGARQHLRRAFKFHAQSVETVAKSIRNLTAARPEEFRALRAILDEELARRP